MQLLINSSQEPPNTVPMRIKDRKKQKKEINDINKEYQGLGINFRKRVYWYKKRH